MQRHLTRGAAQGSGEDCKGGILGSANLDMARDWSASGDDELLIGRWKCSVVGRGARGGSDDS